MQPTGRKRDAQLADIATAMPLFLTLSLIGGNWAANPLPRKVSDKAGRFREILLLLFF
jgi:hypothetical protein